MAIGYTGTVAALSTLVLAFPGDVDDEGQLRTAGSTTVLTKSAARSVAPLLHATGASFERTFARGSAPSTVSRVDPSSSRCPPTRRPRPIKTGVLRHAAQLYRARPDLDVEELG